MLNGESPCSFLPEVRKYYIALQLLDSDDFISMETISDSMYVSKGTVVNDINKLEEFFEKQGLSLERKVKYGVRIPVSYTHLAGDSSIVTMHRPPVTAPPIMQDAMTRIGSFTRNGMTASSM